MNKWLEQQIAKLKRYAGKRLPEWLLKIILPNDTPDEGSDPVATYPWQGQLVVDGGNSGSSHIHTIDQLMAYKETYKLESATVDSNTIRLWHAGTPGWGRIDGNVGTIAMVYRRGQSWFVQGFCGWAPVGRFNNNPATFASNEISNHGSGFGADEQWVSLTTGTRNGAYGRSERSNFVKAG